MPSRSRCSSAHWPTAPATRHKRRSMLRRRRSASSSRTPATTQSPGDARLVRRIVLAALIVVSSGISAHGQTTQVWPEISVFTRLNDRMRFYFLATTVKESRESTEGEFGPNFDFYLRPLREFKRLAGFRLDESKNRVLLIRVGYRYLDSFSADPSEHRVVLEAT